MPPSHAWPRARTAIGIEDCFCHYCVYWSSHRSDSDVLRLSAASGTNDTLVIFLPGLQQECGGHLLGLDVCRQGQ